MNNKPVANFGDEYLFYISNDNEDYKQGRLTTTMRLGSGLNILEISTYNVDGIIESIRCLSSKSIKEDTLSLPPIDSLEKRFISAYFPENKVSGFAYTGEFEIIFNQKEMNIIIDDKENSIKEAFQNDRITYYYDDNFGLSCIRIDNLTEEEYNLLKEESLNPGAFMKNKLNEYLSNDETLGGKTL